MSNDGAAVAGLFDGLAATVESGVSRVRSSSMALAKQVSMRFSQIASTMTGTCVQTDADDSADMSLPKEHKALFDAMRRRHPDAYNNLARISEKFGTLNNKEQFDFMQSEAPAVLSLLATRSRRRKVRRGR